MTLAERLVRAMVRPYQLPPPEPTSINLFVRAGWYQARTRPFTVLFNGYRVSLPAWDRS